MGIIKRNYCKKNQKKLVTFYRAEVYVKGVRVSAKTFSTKKEAVFWHNKEKSKFTDNITNLNDQMRFKDCLEEFCKDAKSRLMKSTLQKYECQLIHLYSSPLANMKMSEIKGIKVVQWLQWLKQQPTAKNPGRKDFVHELKLLSNVFKLV